MTEHSRDEASTLGRGFRIGRVFGVDIVAHWSLVVIFALITASLGGGVFPAWHPEWSAALQWLMAALAATLFFVSIAVHELAHALVGRSQGMPVRRITLFIFGGMAHAQGQPPSAKAEFYIAAIGPAVSLAIGVVATYIGSWLAFRSLAAVPDDPLRMFAAAGPVATLFLWLGPVNILLAIFNMVPGFPLDGGRVLRAILWGITGNLQRATKYATAAGQVFGWILIGSGVLMILGFPVPIFGVGLVPGLWLILIGWFLHTAALMSYQQVLVDQALGAVPVRAVMRTRLQAVPPSLTVESLISDYFMNYDQRSFPVVEEDRGLLGLVCFNDVRAVPRERRQDATVGEVMTPAERLDVVSPEDSAVEAFRRLSERDVDQIPVLRGEHLEGMVQRKDIMKWLSLHARS